MKKNSNYNLKLRKILKTYDSILIKCKNIPALLDKNIVMACDIEGMVNAQIEIGKPIIYINEADSTTFILLDCSDVYVYILKADESKESTIEKMIREVDVAKNMFIKEIMKNVENILLKSNTDSQIYLNRMRLKFFETRVVL